MDTQIQNQLPPLIKKQSTFNLFIPRKVEEKIRYLLHKFPSTEWSGVLFTKHTGSFEDGSLEIYCEDIYPMDLGNATFTSYKMDETVASYIANNIELFDCDLGLVHSHHNFEAYFSGTDINTLREEGNEKNCFVSLIVNNAGTYSAAITRKVVYEQRVTTQDLKTSYEFFGEGTVDLGVDEESSKVVKEEVIEYFMLDVQKEEASNPMEYLDQRFEDIKKKKEAEKKTYYTPDTWTSPFDSYKFTPPEIRYTEYEAEEPKKEKKAEKFDEDLVKRIVAQMITCSLTISPDKVNINAWITKGMKQKYKAIFNTEYAFSFWCDFILEYVSDIINDDKDTACAIYEELETYRGMNEYIDEYLKRMEFLLE